jgi:hypothetical protein
VLAIADNNNQISVCAHRDVFTWRRFDAAVVHTVALRVGSNQHRVQVLSFCLYSCSYRLFEFPVSSLRGKRQSKVQQYLIDLVFLFFFSIKVGSRWSCTVIRHVQNNNHSITTNKKQKKVHCSRGSLSLLLLLHDDIFNECERVAHSTASAVPATDETIKRYFKCRYL